MRNCNKFSKRQILLEFGTCRRELYFSYVLLIFFLSFVIYIWLFLSGPENTRDEGTGNELALGPSIPAKGP